MLCKLSFNPFSFEFNESLKLITINLRTNVFDTQIKIAAEVLLLRDKHTLFLSLDKLLRYKIIPKSLITQLT